MHAPINHIDDTYATWHLHLHTEFVPSNDTQKEETPEMVAEEAISADDKDTETLAQEKTEVSAAPPALQEKNGHGSSSSRSPSPPPSKGNSQATTGETFKTPVSGTRDKAQPNLNHQNAPNTSEKVKPKENTIPVNRPPPSRAFEVIVIYLKYQKQGKRVFSLVFLDPSSPKLASDSPGPPNSFMVKKPACIGELIASTLSFSLPGERGNDYGHQCQPSLDGGDLGDEGEGTGLSIEEGIGTRGWPVEGATFLESSLQTHPLEQGQSKELSLLEYWKC
ncbi:hypothetical protein JHK86_001473 [Glycine max]|nr:hypothetical protein JHK86_001473 [Glycine max]